MAHEDVFAGCHLGRDKTLSRLRAKFHWPGMARDVREICECCTVCQLNRDTNPRLTRELELFPEIQGPFLRLGIDHVGPLPETERGNRYVLVVVDRFTHWVEALAVPDVTAETTARVLLAEAGMGYQLRF